MSSYRDKLNNAKLFIALIDDTVEQRAVKVERCLEQGANVNEKFISNSCNTPLHISVMKEDLATVKLLLKRGAIITCKNIEGKTPLDVAKELNTAAGHAIMKLLETYVDGTDSVNEANKSTIAALDKHELVYRKLLGTINAKGNFYETKLAALLYIRSLVYECDEFYMGLNLKGIGAFSDICVRFKNHGKETIFFIQPKNKKDVRKLIVSNKLTLNKDFDLFPYFQSYLKIRNKFYNKNKNDFIFQGDFEQLTFNFMVYRYLCTDKSVADLVRSGKYDDVFEIHNTDNDVELLTKLMLIDEMKCLGKKLFNFVKKDKFDMMLNDWLIQKYHVVLARSVIDVSEINTAAYRDAVFRKEFLNSHDILLETLRESIFNEVVNEKKRDIDNLESLYTAVINDPTELCISKLMQSIPLCYDKQNNCLIITKTLRKALKKYSEILSNIKIKYSLYKIAHEMAVEETLSAVRFKLPSMFGNIDMAVNNKKGVKRLEYLAQRIKHFMSSFKDNIVIINDKVIGPGKLVDAGVMNLNGGLRSAVGNLLIPSEDDGYYRFNMNDETLHDNAKVLLTLLMSTIPDLNTYKLKLDIKGFPKLSLKASNRDIMLANDFINNLKIYINQQTGNTLDKKVIKMLENYCITSKRASEKSTSSAWYEAIYFNIICELKKWWISKGKSHYWTNNRNFFENILNDTLEKPFVHIISDFYLQQIKNYNIEFDRNTIKSLCYFTNNITLLITDVVTLTGIKLSQYFENNKGYAFVDLSSPLLRFVRDRHVLIKEIKSTELIIFVIIHEDDSESNTELLNNLMNELETKQCILVTNENTFAQIQVQILNKPYTKVADAIIDFNNLGPNSQDKILNNKFTFQGIEMKFGKIIEEKSKNLIDAYILQKIIKNEKNEIGKTLSNAHYEEIQKYYIDRSLRIVKKSLKECLSQTVPVGLYTVKEIVNPSRNKEIVKLQTYEDINCPVILVGASGTGKSTFLTHMSIVTKKLNPRVWIERINLSDHTKEFHRWRESKVKIDRIEALKFVCKAAITKYESKNTDDYDLNTIEFDIEMVNGKLVLRNFEKVKDSNLFELKLFIYCYNQGNTILLFDEFDEICSHYRAEVTEMLRILIMRNSAEISTNNDNHRQRIWITSRSYDIIAIIHAADFGTAYDIMPFSITELQNLMNKYFKIHLNLKDMPFEQFINIDGFLKYMITKKDFIRSSALLQILYYTAAEHFQRQIEYVELTPDRKFFLDKWKSLNINQIRMVDFLRLKDCRIWRYQLYNNRNEESIELELTTLHSIVALDYFVNKIQYIITLEASTNCIAKWKLETNTTLYWNKYLKTIFKKILYGQRNQIQLNDTEIEYKYKEKLKEFLDGHNKVAFYTTFIGVLDEILTQSEIDEIRETIKKFEANIKEKSAIDYILNGVPKFIHIMFQEYLTAEHMWVLIKTKPIEDQPKIWKFIIKYKPQGVLEYLDLKFEDESEVQNVILSDEMKKAILTEVTMDFNYSKNHIFKNDSISSIINNPVFMELRNLTMVLVKTMIDLIDENSLNDFVTFLSKANTFDKRLHYIFGATKWNDVYKNIILQVIKIDPSLFIYFYSEISNNLELLSTVFSLLPKIPKRSKTACILHNYTPNRKFHKFERVIGSRKLPKDLKRRKCNWKRLRHIHGQKCFISLTVCKLLKKELK